MWKQIHSIGMGHPPDISRGGCDASKTFQNTERALESFSKPLSYTLTHTRGVYELSIYHILNQHTDGGQPDSLLVHIS